MQMPEWYLLSAALLLVTISGFIWAPMIYFWPLALIVTLLPVSHIIYNVAKMPGKNQSRTAFQLLLFKITTISFHIFQPLARLLGRVKHDLTPWRNYGKGSYLLPLNRSINVWCNNWIAPEQRLEMIEADLKSENVCVERGDIYDRWDLLIKGGALGSAKLFMAAEDHNGGKQYLRFRIVPRISLTAICLMSFPAFLLVISLLNKTIIPALVFGAIFLVLIFRLSEDYGRAYSAAKDVVKKQSDIK
jgi:O-antigen biosynthesis protein